MGLVVGFDLENSHASVVLPTVQVFPSGGKQYSTLRLAAQNGDQAFRPTCDVPIKAGTWTVRAWGIDLDVCVGWRACADIPCAISLASLSSSP